MTSKIRPRSKEKTLPVLIGELDDVFSEFIRLRDTRENGYVHCFICGHQMSNWRMSQNMHYIDRAKMPTRFDEMNCHAGCISCNCMDEMHKIKYEQKLILKYGIDKVVAMEAKARGLQKFMRYELIEMIGFYKGKISGLRN